MCDDRPLTEEGALAALDGTIRYYARRIARGNPAVEEEDLYQVGAAAVVEYVRSGRYDPAVGSVRTALQPRIRGAMLDEVREQSWVPRVEVERLKASGESGVKMVHLSGVRLDRRGTFGGGDGSVMRCDPPHHDPPPSDHPEAEFLAVVRGLCAGLSEVERRVLVLYYVRGLKMVEIAGRVGLSESRVSQIHTDIMLRMRGGRQEPQSPKPKSQYYQRRKDGTCLRCRQPVGGGSTVYCAHHLEKQREHHHRRVALARAKS